MLLHDVLKVCAVVVCSLAYTSAYSIRDKTTPQYGIPCSSDSSCPINHFCYMTTNLCAPCKKEFCQRINRADSGWRSCHKEFTDCGPCLPGYEVELLTDGSPRGACILSRKEITTPPLHLQDTEGVTHPYGTAPYVVIIFLFLLSSILGILLFVSYKKRSSPAHPSNRNLPEEIPLTTRQCGMVIHSSPPPPPYNPEPSAPIDPSQGTRVFNHDVNVRVDIRRLSAPEIKDSEVHKQTSRSASSPGSQNNVTATDYFLPTKTFETVAPLTASPFLIPNYETESVESESEPSDEETINEAASPSFVDVDESTQPSDWRPEPLPSQLELRDSAVEEPRAQNKRPTNDAEAEEEDGTKKMRLSADSDEESEEIYQPSTDIDAPFQILRRPNDTTE